jgi:hypothetical protein
MGGIQTISNFIARVLKKTERNKINGQRQLWWIDNKIGGYDGYELRPGGKLFLLNWDLFTGIKWAMNEKEFYTEMVYKKNGTLLKKTAEILLLTDQKMVLKTVEPNNEFTDTYVKISYGNVADKFYGHFINGESYVQVIPVHEYQFQIVFSEHNKGDVVKYFGNLDDSSKTLQLRMNGQVTHLLHRINGNAEELIVGDKKYYRPLL